MICWILGVFLSIAGLEVQDFVGISPWRLVIRVAQGER